MNRFDHDYSFASNEFKVCSLQSFRSYRDAMYLFKILVNLIDEPSLLTRINIHVPSRTLRRNNMVFNVNIKDKMFNNVSFIDRTSALFNNYLFEVDYNNLSISLFKKVVREKLLSFN